MPTSEDRCREAIRAIPTRLVDEPFLKWRGRRFSHVVLLGVGHATPFLLRFHEGELTDLMEDPPPLQSWDFAIRGPADAWLAHWEALPKPGFHDLFAMSKAGHLRIEGNLHPLMTNLQFLKDLLALPRGMARAGR